MKKISTGLNRIKPNYFILIFLLLAVPCSMLPALDFGLVLNNYAGYGTVTDKDGSFEYTGRFVPRFSALIGDNGSFFMSAKVMLDYNSAISPAGDKIIFVPELLRTELFFKFNNTELSAGRIGYSDPLGFVISGLFDGVRITHASSNAGKLGFGAFYTGLQYKETANITMTQVDKAIYDKEFKLDNFANTYFAPRRLIASFDWEHPAVLQRMRLRAALLGQFDLTDGNEKINSQYLILKAGLNAGSLLFEAGGSLSAMQTENTNDDFKLALAGDFGIHWIIPASFNNRLSLTASLTGGVPEDDSLGAFNPVTTEYFGEIFQARMTSLSVLGISYSARFLEPLGFNFKALYFMRHDLITPNAYIITDPGENLSLLGAEFYARFILSLVSDIQFIIGGGAFVPSLGQVWPDEKPRLKAGLSCIISL